MSDQLRDLIDKLAVQYLDFGNSIRQIDELIPKKIIIPLVKITPADDINLAFKSLYNGGGRLICGPGKYPAIIHSQRELQTLITVESEDSNNRASIAGFTARNKSCNVVFFNTDFHTDGPVSPTNHISLGGDKTTMKIREEVPFGFSFINTRHRGPARRAFMANCADLLIEDIDADDYYEKGTDSQAIAGWNGCRNHMIRTSKLSAASENIIYGGADAANLEMYPEGITFDKNVFSKKEEWRTLNYNMKCLMEFKNAKYVLISYNTLKDTWRQAWGNSPAIMIKAANQENTNPYAESSHFTIINNDIYNVGDYITIIGQRDGNYNSGICNDILIKNNFMHKMHAIGSGRATQIGDGPRNVKILQNTILDNINSFMEMYGIPGDDIHFTDNVTGHGYYGLINNSPTYVPEIERNIVELNPTRKYKLTPSNTYVPAPIRDYLIAHPGIAGSDWCNYGV